MPNAAQPSCGVCTDQNVYHAMVLNRFVVCTHQRALLTMQLATVAVCKRKWCATPIGCYSITFCTNKMALRTVQLPIVAVCKQKGGATLSDWCKMRSCRGTGGLHQSEGVVSNVAAKFQQFLRFGFQPKHLPNFSRSEDSSAAAAAANDIYALLLLLMMLLLLKYWGRAREVL